MPIERKLKDMVGLVKPADGGPCVAATIRQVEEAQHQKWREEKARQQEYQEAFLSPDTLGLRVGLGLTKMPEIKLRPITASKEMQEDDGDEPKSDT